MIEEIREFAAIMIRGYVKPLATCIAIISEQKKFVTAKIVQ